MRAIFALIAVSVVLAGALAAQDSDEKPRIKRGGPSSHPSDSRTIQATGIVRQVDDKSITVEADDTRIITAKLTASTSYTGPNGKVHADAIDLGAKVRISAQQGADELTASSIELIKPPITADDDSGKVRQQEDADADRPKLRRGMPSDRKKPDDDVDIKPATSDADTAKVSAQAAATVARLSAPPPDAPVKPRGNIPVLLQKAAEVNQNFVAKLPNFVCKQFTTRYQRELKATGWQAQDVITATVIYSDGKEQYQNIKVGNKSSNAKDIVDVKGGQTSNGEFGTILEYLMYHAYDGDFRPAGDELVRGAAAKIFSFKVAKPSEWSVFISGQTIHPGYSGRVWIDKSTGRALRIERQADDIPEAFPMDTIEQTLDYDYVLLGDSKVLLPSESQNLSCQRGTPFCSKNVIEFRNYRQFKGEATIQYEDK